MKMVRSFRPCSCFLYNLDTKQCTKTIQLPNDIIRHFFSSKTTSWERNAQMVKDTIKVVENKYVNQIRETHDPALHLKTLEDEIRGTMSQALRRQGDKILSALHAMQLEREKHDEMIRRHHEKSQNSASSSSSVHWKARMECIQRHNEFRKQAITARWELIVHRQAVGMIVNNHKFVHDMFPIGDALPEMSTGDALGDVGKEILVDSGTVEPKVSPKRFGDQLDWWQHVGRWK